MYVDGSSLIAAEIAFEHRVSRSRGLSAFRRNPTTWELLMILASKPDGFMDGLHEVPTATGTRYLGQSALLKFIREQRDAGMIQFLEHEKRSKRILKIDPALAAELVELLHQRLEAVAGARQDTASDGHHPDGQESDPHRRGGDRTDWLG